MLGMFNELYIFTNTIHMQKNQEYPYPEIFLLYLEKYLCLTLLILIVPDNKQNS